MFDNTADILKNNNHNTPAYSNNSTEDHESNTKPLNNNINKNNENFLI